MRYLEKSNSQRQKEEYQLPGTRENGELLLNGCGVSVWADEKTLEINSGDSCTTV